MQNTLTVRDIFHIANNTTFLVCEHPDVNLLFPGEWKLYRVDVCISTVKLEGLVMDNGWLQKKLTVWTHGHLDKSVFDFSCRMQLRECT